MAVTTACDVMDRLAALAEEALRLGNEGWDEVARLRARVQELEEEVRGLNAEAEGVEK